MKTSYARTACRFDFEEIKILRAVPFNIVLAPQKKVGGGEGYAQNFNVGIVQKFVKI